MTSEDVGHLSIAQDILRKNTAFYRRIIAPASGVEAWPCYTSARIVMASRWMITYCGCHRGMATAAKFPPIEEGLERVVMGDMCRHRKDTTS